ncbi:MAG: TadE/TadG family type IV pilus assembly protein [Pirellulaceae bacterium]
MNKRRFRRHSNQASRQGAAAVEFAVVAPLMILLTMGMMEIGRVVMVQQLLVNASREGARLAVLPGIEEVEVQNQVIDDLESMAIMGATVLVTNDPNAAGGSSVTVDISIPAQDISWVPNPAFTLDKVLHASTTMRHEGQ